MRRPGWSARLAALFVLAGCLPHGAVGKREEIEADRYAVSLEVVTTTEPPVVPAFTWTVSGELDWTFARQFRDGSHGWLVTGHGFGTAERPSPLDGLVVEVRTFPSGEILAVTGAAALAGTHGHVEVLDVLWPALSPRLPEGRGPTYAPFGTGWPTWLPGNAKLQSRLLATWAETPTAWTWSGSVQGSADRVRVEGTGDGTLTLGSPNRVQTHSFHWDRQVSTRWPQATLVQHQAITGRLEHRGRVPPPAFDRPPPSESLGADMQPLRLHDGRVVRDDRAVPASTLPFLLLPDDWGAEAVAKLTATVLGAGTITPVEPTR